MKKEDTRSECIRCGDCCLRSSPSLHGKDLALVREGVIKKRDLLTVRKGELVRDNVHEDLTASPHELVKIREKQEGISGGCIFYDEAGAACRIYEHRPEQCSALKCWDTGDFMAVFKRPKPGRRELIDDNILLGLMDEHDRRCCYEALEKDIKHIEEEGEAALERMIDRLKFDTYLRPFITEKLDIPSDEMDFLFGRPLIKTLPMFGLQVIREPDGSYLLTSMK